MRDRRRTRLADSMRAGAACDERIGRIRDGGEDERGDAHHRYLKHVVTGGVDELREEGAEEDQRLRVADGDEETLQEEAPARAGRRFARRKPAARAQHLPAHPDEIGGAQEPQQFEPMAHRLDDGGQADAGNRDHDGDAGLRAGDIGKTGADAVAHARRDDQRDGRPRHHDDDEAGDDIGDVEFERHLRLPQGGRMMHCATKLSSTNRRQLSAKASSTSLACGIAGCAPGFRQASEPAAAARRSACSSGRPASSPAPR